MVDVGVVRPEEFALALLHIIKPDKATVLRLGHWPRRKATQATPQTVYALQLTKLILSFAGVYAPGRPITSILIEQRSEPVHHVRYVECALRIKPGKLKVAVMSQGRLMHKVSYDIENAERNLILFAGNNHDERIPPKRRMQLKKAGFSLQFVD